MSREKGSTSYSGNFEVQKAGPLDARGLVDTFEDLINPTIWNALDGGLYAYPGMTVSVPNDPDISKIGVYMLKKLPTIDRNNWVKIGKLNVTIEEIPNSGGQLRGIITI